MLPSSLTLNMICVSFYFFVLRELDRFFVVVALTLFLFREGCGVVVRSSCTDMVSTTFCVFVKTHVFFRLVSLILCTL